MAVANNSGIETAADSWAVWARRVALVISALISLLTGFSQARASQADADRLMEAVLAVHNQARSAAKVPPIEWSEDLARSAHAWATHIAGIGYMVHSDDRRSQEEGENLWMGTAGAYSYELMVSDWASEAKYFKAGMFPNVSTTGDWKDAGHFTQMIWRETRRVGCAVVSSGSWDYLVCRYSSPGNIYGKRPI